MQTKKKRHSSWNNVYKLLYLSWFFNFSAQICFQWTYLQNYELFLKIHLTDIFFCQAWKENSFTSLFFPLRLYYFQLVDWNDCFYLLGLIKQFGSLMGLVRVEDQCLSGITFCIIGALPAESPAQKPEVNFTFTKWSR